MTIQKPITLQEAKSIARHLGLTLRQARSGHYRVNFRDGGESAACYAVDSLAGLADSFDGLSRVRRARWEKLFAAQNKTAARMVMRNAATRGYPHPM